MAAATALGGFSGPEADTLGYAIRKKKSSVLRSMKDQFVRQAGERGVGPDTIDAVFKAFEPFERYGFNKAHATTYGLVAYQTAYLKANYTVEYMASVLTGCGTTPRRSRRPWPSAAGSGSPSAAGCPRQPPGVHRQGAVDPVRPPRRQERQQAPSSRSLPPARPTAASVVRRLLAGSTFGS